MQPRIMFMGSKSGGLAVCRFLCERIGPPAMVLCPDDRDDRRTRRADFEALATAHRVPLHIAGSADEAASAIESVAPQFAFVHGWYRVIPLARFPQTQFFGFHYAPLPAYRGNAPLVWQILRGEPELGVTMFRFGSGIDDGDIAAQRRLRFGPDETIADALDRAEQACLEMCTECVAPLMAGCWPLVRQAEEGASWCGLRVPEDGEIDWTLPARRVHDFVRAQTRPYPGAFTTLADGRILRLWRTRVEERAVFGTPGAVVAVESPQVVVACGEGALRIVECGTDQDGDAAAAALIGSMRVRLARARHAR